jgi:hypothetical protein
MEQNPGVIPSIPAGIKTPEGTTTSKYRRESFIPAGIKTPALFTTARSRWESRHRRESQRQNPSGIPVYRRELRHRQESQRQIPVGITTVRPGLTRFPPVCRRNHAGFMFIGYLPSDEWNGLKGYLNILIDHGGCRNDHKSCQRRTNRNGQAGCGCGTLRREVETPA